MQKIDPLRLMTENATLGYMLCWNECFDELRLILGEDPTVFSDPHAQDVYNALLKCKDAGDPVDIIGAYKHMERKSGEFLAYLTEEHISPSPVHAPQRAKEVLDWHRGDLVAKISLQAIQDASTGVMGSEQIAKLMGDLSKLTERQSSPEFQYIGPILTEILQDIQDKRENPDPFTGVPTGMREFDRIMCGLRPGTMNVIAARPGVGKSAMAANIARNAALNGYPVLFFSMEMPAKKVISRCLTIECDTSYETLTGIHGVKENNQKISTAVSHLGDIKLAVVDTGDTTPAAFASISRKFAAMNKPKMSVIILDYLQLCKIPDFGKKNRYESVGEFTRAIKQLSRELDCPIVVLSQLSREADESTEPFRCNHCLRESGNIEQDADTITIMLALMDKRMEEFYKEQGYGEGQVLNCAITKNREGRTGRCNMYFEKETQYIVPVKDHTLRYSENQNEEEPF